MLQGPPEAKEEAHNIIRIAITFASAMSGAILLLHLVADRDGDHIPELAVLGVLASTYTVLTGLGAVIDRRARRDLQAALEEAEEPRAKVVSIAPDPP